ncbi:unnamed protein product [Effrenium voratum]|nr:unnamed protein product [Effrenium voratum]
MSAEARAVFTGLQACCNTRGALLRNGADDNGSAARAGCAPWHIAMLAAANLIWELSIEETTQVQIQDHHILRAWEQVQVSHALVDIWCQQEAFAKVEDSGAWTLSAAQKLAAAQEAGRLPTSQFGAFEAVEDDDVLAEAGEELPALLTIMDPDVPALTCGYGENGASVQDPALGEVVMSDRALMQPTLLRGEPCIFGFRVIDSTVVRKKVECPGSSGAKFQRTAVKIHHWKAVMEAGLRDSRIARYCCGADAEERPNCPRVFVDLPDCADELALRRFHNELMMLCQLPFSTLADRVRSKAEKAPRIKKEQKKPVAAPIDLD